MSGHDQRHGYCDFEQPLGTVHMHCHPTPQPQRAPAMTDPTPKTTQNTSFLATQLRDPANYRQWGVDAHDGVIATSGLLLGFAGAGAGDRLLIFTAVAATIVGAVSTGGGQWAENAAERDAQLMVARNEQLELATNPEGELDELTEFLVTKGLSPDLARKAAESLSARDALAAQLEWEHGFTEPVSVGFTLFRGLSSALGFTAGALIPLTITYFAPVDIEVWAIMVAAVAALIITSAVTARSGGTELAPLLVRGIAVGAITMLASYLAGLMLV